MAAPRVPPTTSLFRQVLSWFRGVLKPLHQLWLEVTGTVFLALAVFGVAAAVREWRSYQEGESLLRLATTIFFIVMMGAFGVYSFWKARRLR